MVQGQRKPESAKCLAKLKSPDYQLAFLASMNSYLGKPYPLIELISSQTNGAFELNEVLAMLRSTPGYSLDQAATNIHLLMMSLHCNMIQCSLFVSAMMVFGKSHDSVAILRDEQLASFNAVCQGRSQYEP
jgi:hypothetical protein